MPAAIYLPEARDDIDAVYAGYEAQVPGLGERFLAALARTVAAVEGNPYLYGEVAAGVRAGPLRRFPFVVYYKPLGSVLVIAIRHGQDDPAVWQGRA